MRRETSVLVAFLASGALAACAAISGLDQYSVEDCPWGACGSADAGDATVRPEASPPEATTGTGDTSAVDGNDDSRPGADDGGDVPDGSLDGGPLDDTAPADGPDASTCALGLLACEGGCVSPSDPLNCGTCGNVCSPQNGTPSCQAPPDTNRYVCVSGCLPATPVLCGETCVDTRSDPTHCGACDAGCAASGPNTHPVCADGGCGFACDTGYALCDGGCLQYTNASNCGGCGVACDPDGGLPVCAPTSGAGVDGGPYACASGCPSSAPTRCSGACADTTSDPGNCSACGHACPTVAHGHAVCAAGSCSVACDAGYTPCNGACVDEGSDPNSCGGCGVGHVCGVNQTCAGGVCITHCQATSDCPTGYACNGTVCTTSCSASQPCHGGCCSGGTCVSGLAAAACGSSGGLCTSCSAQSTNTACISGVCGCTVATDCAAQTACSPALHACLGLCGGANTGCNGGCCTDLTNGGTCVAGSSDTRCGSTGGQCNDCQTGCSPGPRCIGNACGCGPGSLDCLASACSGQGLLCTDAGTCHP